MTPLQHLHWLREEAKKTADVSSQIPENVALARKVQGFKKQGIELRPDINFMTEQIIRQDEMTGDEEYKITTAGFNEQKQEWEILPNVPHSKRTEFKYRANRGGKTAEQRWQSALPIEVIVISSKLNDPPHSQTENCEAVPVSQAEFMASIRQPIRYQPCLGEQTYHYLLPSQPRN